MLKVQFSDQDYLEGLRGNDQKVIQSLYKTHFSMILKMVLNNNGTEAEAKDIFQESIIVLYRNAGSEGFKLTCSIQTYLYSISKRLWLKQLSRHSGLTKFNDNGSEEMDLKDSHKDLEHHEEKEIQLNQLADSLEKLGEPCRTLIEDFYVRQLGMDQIAEKFGYTNADNAKTQKYKCLQRLKKLFFLNKED